MLNSKNAKSPIGKWAKNRKEHFTKEDTNVKWKHEKMFNITRHQGNAKMWAITTYLSEQLKLKVMTISNGGKDVGEIELLLWVEMQKDTGILEKSLTIS